MVKNLVKKFIKFHKILEMDKKIWKYTLNSLPVHLQKKQLNYLSISSFHFKVSNNQNDNLALATLTTGLASDSSNKYVQEWLVANRFAHLLDTFAHYTSNDILRLTKEDLVSLCGPPDGIRCFNVAHNIQIKPRLTLFVTFQRQSYFSAVFIADWKNQFLSYKILELYNSFVDNVHSGNEKKKLSRNYFKILVSILRLL